MASNARTLRVESGLHADAVAELTVDGMSVIGSAADCEIHLFDPNIAPRHAAIASNGNSQMLRCMDGNCVLNGRHLLTGESCIIEPGDRIQLGESEVIVCIEHESVIELEESLPDASQRAARATKAIALCMLALVFATTVVSGILGSQKPERDPLAEVNSAIAALGATDSVSVAAQNGAVRVNGIVTEPHFSQLRAALQEFEFAVVNSTQSSTMLLEQVRSVFRTNGYHTELAYRGDGVVEVQNLDASNPQVQEVSARVRTDVPAVTKLEFAETGNGWSQADALAYPTDPDKRLTTIVDGEIAYVATEDGGRYFVGGILPGGFVLKSINEAGIQVDDNGEIRWLKL